jgi:hypothetical protein
MSPKKHSLEDLVAEKVGASPRKEKSPKSNLRPQIQEVTVSRPTLMSRIGDFFRDDRDPEEIQAEIRAETARREEVRLRKRNSRINSVAEKMVRAETNAAAGILADQGLEPEFNNGIWVMKYSKKIDKKIVRVRDPIYRTEPAGEWGNTTSVFERMGPEREVEQIKSTVRAYGFLPNGKIWTDGDVDILRVARVGIDYIHNVQPNEDVGELVDRMSVDRWQEQLAGFVARVITQGEKRHF